MLRKLKQAYAGDFYITTSVYQETIGKASTSLRFRYEGHRLKELLDDGIIKVYSDEKLSGQIADLMNSINHTYFANGQPMTIVQLGEMSTAIACLEENAESFAVDERIARLLIEDPSALKPWLEHKLHTAITIDNDVMQQWSSKISGKFMPLRSIEFAMAAWKNGILGDDKDVLFGLLWALKFAGCAITEDEISFYTKKTTKQNGQR